MVISAVGLDSGFPKAPAHTHTLSTFSCIVSLPPQKINKAFLCLTSAEYCFTEDSELPSSGQFE